jgi:hypothetical protein
MSKEPTLTQQTKTIFLNTVDLYRNDALKLVRDPTPVIILAGVIALLWLAIAVS